MKITNQNTLKQALANIRLSSLSLPREVKDLLDKTSTDKSIDTKDVIKLLIKRSPSRSSL